MLSQRYNDQLSELLIAHEEWTPHPKASDRPAWGLPHQIFDAHIARGESAAEYDWPVATATFFLDYQRTGNRMRWQTQIRDKRRQTLSDLVMAECLEGQGRFIDPIIDGIWTTCEETFWGVPAHLGRQGAGVGLPDVTDPIVDLFAAEAAALLAWTLYLLEAQLDEQSPLIADRMRLEIDRRILTPCLEREFGWMGFNNARRRANNWNPWIVSNWLTCTLVVESGHDRRTRLVARALEAVDNFIDPYPKDGGCDEGPGYWNHAGGALFDCLEILLSASDGKIDVYDDPLIQEIGRFPYRTQIDDRYFVNFADAAARISLPPAITFGYGKRIGDPHLIAIGAWSARNANLTENGLSDSLGRQLRTLAILDELLEAEPRTPLPKSSWLPEIEVFCARDSEGTAEGLFLAGKGGHNEESHNHNDIGSFVVYIDGAPLIVDIGVEDYTAKTFGPDRYDIWTMNSSHHSLPTINGVQQAPGPEYKARDVSFTDKGERVTFECDIAGCYEKEAGVQSWQRTITYTRGQQIQVSDVYELIRVNGFEMNLITPCKVRPNGDALRLESTPLDSGGSSASGKIVYDPGTFDVALDSYLLDEVSFKRGERHILDPVGNPWGRELTRVRFVARNVESSGSYELLFSA